MRFTLIKDLKKDRSMNPILKGLLFFITLYLISDVFLKYTTFGVSVSQIKISLFGNIDTYIDPMSQSVFLEFVHSEIFFLMMILLTLNAIFIRLMHTKPLSILITNITMISAIISLLSIILTYFYVEFFVYIYVVSFFLWHISALYMTLSSLAILSFD